MANRERADVDLPSMTRPPSRSQTPMPGISRAASQMGQDNKPPRPKLKKRAPQHNIDEFWDKFSTKTPGKAFTILPDNLYAKRAAAHAPKGVTLGQNAVASYDQAVAACKAKVEKIVKECKRINQKYRDPHFDIEADFRKRLTGAPPDCLMGLTETRTELRPQAVKRVEDIFEAPQFFIEGATFNDVRQGNDGDCWFMSALSTLNNMDGLLQRVCVAQEPTCGVYGFVFHRDGEWISEVIDDKLYLVHEDYDESGSYRKQWETQNRTSPEEEYRAAMQTGSRALYFAQCTDPNETWTPLLEKAYAKAHGDYSAINGGFVGEGIEDLTGGVTTELFTTDILDKKKFWDEELMKVNKEFLFGCGQMNGIYGQRKGVIERHAYSILEARELDGQKLLKLRNPWGNTEWKGAWSDGSAEWTPEWMTKLNHRFGDDGVFWISYADLLRVYQHFDRTRLFGPEWTVTQQWTSLNVPWTVDYLDTKFKISLAKTGPVVIVLSQLDDRYFRGLEGQYEFHLQFRLHKDGEDEYIVRSNGTYYMKRSVSTELELEAGDYSVLLKILAKRYPEDKPPEQVIQETCHTRREKLLSIGLSYDLAHAKGHFKELEKVIKEQEKQAKLEEKKANAKKAHAARRQQHRKMKLRQIKQKMKQELREEAKAKKAQKKAAEAANFDPAESTKLERQLEDFRMRDSERTNGLGITANGDDTLTEEPPKMDSATPALKSDSNAADRLPNGHPPTSVPNGLHKLPTTSTSRPASPRPSATAPVRRDTSTASPFNAPSRRNTLSPALPTFRVQRPSIPHAPSLSEISDDDLSWDSEIDAPSSASDSDADSALRALEFGMRGGPGFGSRGRGGRCDDADEEDDGLEADPWNAVCVVGLRVYSREGEVKIEVVKPGRKGGVLGEEKTLDVDDSAKDATKGLGANEGEEEGVLKAGGGCPANVMASRQG